MAHRRLAVRDDRCYTGGMRDRVFFPLCAAAAVLMVALAMIAPRAPEATPPRPAAQPAGASQ